MPRATTFAGLGLKLRELKLENTPEVRRVVAGALIPLRDRVKQNVRSVSGRTVAATKIIEGHGNKYTATAYVKVDKSIAFAMSRGRRTFYPRVVEAGHGGIHAAPSHPFFSDAIRSTRTQVADLLETGVAELILAKAAE